MIFGRKGRSTSPAVQADLPAGPSASLAQGFPRIALHEAAHAGAAFRLGRRVEQISLESDGSGYTRLAAVDVFNLSRGQAVDECTIRLIGDLMSGTESPHLPAWPPGVHIDDLTAAEMIADEAAAGPGDGDRILAEARARAVGLLEDTAFRRGVEGLAWRLNEQRSIAGAVAEALLEPPRRRTVAHPGPFGRVRNAAREAFRVLEAKA